MKAKNIRWDVAEELAEEIMDEGINKVEEVLGFDLKPNYLDIEECLKDALEKMPLDKFQIYVDKYLELPYEVHIPILCDDDSEESAFEYLTERYGYYPKGFELIKEKFDMKKITQDLTKVKITQEKLKYILDIYLSNRETLGELEEEVDDICETFEQGYNNGIEFVLNILGIEYRLWLKFVTPIHTNLKVVIIIGNINCITYYLDIFKIR